MKESKTEKIGYARASREDQNLDLQMEALLKVGIKESRIYTDKASGASLANRIGLECAIRALEPGWQLVVWKTDRLGRNVSEVIATVELIRAKGADLVSLTEPIDTVTAIGKMFFHIVAMFAQFERDLLIERTQAGLAASRKKGIKAGPKQRFDEAVEDEIIGHLRSGLSVREIAPIVGFGKSWIYRHMPRLHAKMAEEDASRLRKPKATARAGSSASNKVEGRKARSTN